MVHKIQARALLPRGGRSCPTTALRDTDNEQGNLLYPFGSRFEADTKQLIVLLLIRRYCRLSVFLNADFKLSIAPYENTNTASKFYGHTYYTFLGDARTQSPTTKNCAPEFPTFGEIAGFNWAKCNAESPPGGTAFLITVSSVPGKLAHSSSSHAYMQTSAMETINGFSHC